MVLTFAGASVPLFRWFLFCFERVIHSRSRSYYLFFNYLFFNYLYGGSLYAENLGGGGSLYAENVAVGGFTICVENWPESLPSVDNFVARVAVGGPRSGCRRFRHPPRGRPRVAGPSEAALADAVGPRFASLEGSS